VLVRLVLWNLADSKTTIAELRWGAVYVWESREAAEQELPSRARALIGKDPDLGEEFDVEATVEGRFAIEELSRRGLAFE
jgi:hypothetical protein